MFHFPHINCDLGEGFGREDEIMSCISACNIACGGHAGNEQIMAEVVDLALFYQVEIGAHPAYPDPENFGRLSLSMKKEKFIQTIQHQMKTLQWVLDKKKAMLTHIKAHGALYNDLAVNEPLCYTFLSAIASYKNRVALYAPFGSVLLETAKRAGWKTLTEAFTDRNYTSDYQLVSRQQPNALIKDPQAIAAHLKRIAFQKKLICIDGNELPMKADTFCFHSDGENSAETLKKVIKILHDENSN